jgi:hypothetical protein
MHGPRHLLCGLALALQGCGAPCEGETFDISSGDDGAYLSLDVAGVDEPLSVELQIPGERGARFGDAGAPVVVFVQGGMSAEGVPVLDGQPRIVPGYGLVALYLDLPGAESPLGAVGIDDLRGSWARQALAGLLRYAAGEDRDAADCVLSDRVAVGLSGELLLAGQSNGGNLAWATLADQTLDVPEVLGVAAFETPISGQLALVEPGSSQQDGLAYQDGSCSLASTGALRCDMDYGALRWDDGTGELSTDLDGDGSADFALGVANDPSTGLDYHSVQALEASAAQGLDLGSTPDASLAAVWWAEREASQHASAVVDRFPDLAAISVGTEVDHGVDGAGDHPHVTGLITALQSAGARWTRVNPGPTWAAEVAGDGMEWADNPPNQVVEVGDPKIAMEPEADSAWADRSLLTAALLELADRQHNGDWEE